MVGRDAGTRVWPPRQHAQRTRRVCCLRGCSCWELRGMAMWSPPPPAGRWVRRSRVLPTRRRLSGWRMARHLVRTAQQSWVGGLFDHARADVTPADTLAVLACARSSCVIVPCSVTCPGQRCTPVAVVFVVPSAGRQANEGELIGSARGGLIDASAVEPPGWLVGNLGRTASAG